MGNLSDFKMLFTAVRLKLNKIIGSLSNDDSDGNENSTKQ